MLGWPEARRRALRGGRIGTIFQEPLTALNPLHKVEKQIGEAIRVHQRLGREAVRRRCLELLEQVELPASDDMLARFPHQLSGGQRQRVMIAMALANDPQLLIADEPTTALDVTIQETILDLLKRLQRERHLSILLISHDLGLVGRFAEDVAVMHRGRIVERGATDQVLNQPRDAYTRHLLDAEPAGRPIPCPPTRRCCCAPTIWRCIFRPPPGLAGTPGYRGGGGRRVVSGAPGRDPGRGG